jgi:3-oxoacyl-[acyl-carrier protein] reductase
MRLTGKIALVTGASRGIGKAIALRLAQDGAKLAINNLDIETAETVAAEIKALGGMALAVAGDVSSTDEVNDMMETIISTYGSIDILVNNAGITRDQLLLRMADDDWDRVLAVNLKGVFLCTKAVLKYMLKARWGRIINMSSIVGFTGNYGQSNYAASKAGIMGFTRSVAREVASRGITVNAVAPGFIETDMTARLSEKQRQDITSRIPLGFLGTPEDVASIAAFLAGEDSRYITGQVISVDGGLGGI